MIQDLKVLLYCQATYEACIRFISFKKTLDLIMNQFSVTPDQLICELKGGSIATGRKQELTIRPRTSLIAKMQAHKVSLGVKIAVRATPKVNTSRSSDFVYHTIFRAVWYHKRYSSWSNILKCLLRKMKTKSFARQSQ